MTNLIFNPLTLSLYGKILIEASAGTGKTYNISILYLRLLLGLRKPGYKNTPLTVEEILVVTFTEAATLELKKRIKKNIHDLRIACICHKSDNPDFIGILAQIDNLKQARVLLLIAELQIESTASIYTIHSFCYRMLYLNGIIPTVICKEHQLIENDSLIKESIMDFWDRHCSLLPVRIAQEVSKEWSSPEELLHTLIPLFRQNPPILKQQFLLSSTLPEEYQKIISQIILIKKQFLLEINDIKNFIYKSSLSQNCNHKLSIFFKKISKWAQQETYNCSFPKEIFFIRKNILIYSDNKIDIYLLKQNFIENIEKFFTNIISLREWIIGKSLQELPYFIKKTKKSRSVLTFDDLLQFLDEALQQYNGRYLAHDIRNHYPVALIDEFQDTDSIQYRIFNTIYNGHYNNLLILIADPKQAIYSFRGANIFTYLQAVDSIKKRYTLNINWRSSSGLVMAINQLFSQNQHPFLWKNIPFIQVKSSISNSKLRLIFNQKQQVPFRICLQPGAGVNISEYQYFMSRYCASDIFQWLTASKKKQVHLIDSNNNIRYFSGSDLVILVRNRNEARIMQNALSHFHINSIYVSSEENVYVLVESYEILLLLKAILIPEKKWLYGALSTRIFNLNIINLKKIIQHNHLIWNKYLTEFTRYKQIWKNYGLLSMFQEIINSSIFSKTLIYSSNKFNPTINNYFHIMEILQEKSTSIDSQYTLVHWLEEQINKSKNQMLPFTGTIKSEDNNLIKIISIHQSKGLQYPVVWVPFTAYFRNDNHLIYHDRLTLQKILDLRNEEESIRLSYEERLAEDLRLLYVALTRSIWYCSIGICPLMKGNKQKREGNTDLHHTAIGYLLQQGKSNNAQELISILDQIKSKNISVVYTENITLNDNDFFENYANKFYSSPILDKNFNHYSYNSNIQNTLTTYSITQELFPYSANEVDFSINNPSDNNFEQCIIHKSRHTFPKGLKSNIFLHKLLEQIKFNKIMSYTWYKNYLNYHGVDTSWTVIIKNWINDICNLLLIKELDLSLSKLSQKNTQISWKFLLKLDSREKIKQIEQLINCSFYDSLRNFQQFNGIFTGIIDLIFQWKEKYYLLDYKTQWLGKNESFYTSEILQSISITHHLKWQSYLSTLAFHRYLQYRLPHYSYQTNFGGVYYLFLRGIGRNTDYIKNSNGIFTYFPSIELINSLDNLFINK
ncbi:MAG: exodeoxyribonuclease V subunit beta [Candidatus Dasytiphilus stammeri]